MHTRLSLITYAFLAILVLGCTKEVKVNTLEPQLALPFIKGNFDMVDFFGSTDSSEIVFDGNGQVSLQYRGETRNISPNEVFQFPQLNLDFSLINQTENIPSMTNGQQATFEGELSVPIIHNGMKPSHISVSVGDMSGIVSSNIPHDIQVQFNLKGSKGVGGFEKFVNVLSIYQDGAHTVSYSSNLKNTEINFDETLIEYNTLPISYTVWVTGKNGAPLLIGDRVDVNLNLNIEYYYEARGSGLATQPIDISERDIFLRLFQRTLGEQVTNFVTFTNPSLEFTFENPHQIVGGVDFRNLTSNNAEKTSQGEIEINGGNRFSFEAFQPGFPATSFVVDRNNSNIREVLTPVEDLVSFAGTVNYGNNPGGEEQVINGLKSAKLKSTLYLPLTGFAENWVLADTVDIDFSSINAQGNEAIADVLFKLNTDNGLPVDVELQVYFVDGNAQVIDSLFNLGKFMLKSGELNGEGRVVEPSRNSNETIVSLDRYQRIADETKKAYVKAQLKTGAIGTNEVRLFSDNFFSFQLGVNSKFAIDIQ